MAFTDAPTLENRKTAIGGVIAVHAGIGALLVFGLAESIKPIIDDTLEGTFIPVPEETPEPPPLPETPPEAQRDETTLPPIFTPVPTIDLPAPTPPIDSTNDFFPPASDPIINSGPATSGTGTTPKVAPKPTPTPPPPAFDPVAAQPANDPATWITANDYRSSWIRREMVGSASFRLSVSTKGQVDNCTITSGTGHSAMDTATCKLITKRARFTPARGTDGKPAQGAYSGSIRWVLPE